jgi:hypothetical protein
VFLHLRLGSAFTFLRYGKSQIGSFTVIKNPPKSKFQLGSTYIYEVLLANICSLPECYEIYFDTL